MSERAWMHLHDPGGGKPRHYAGAKPIVGNTGVVAGLAPAQANPCSQAFHGTCHCTFGHPFLWYYEVDVQMCISEEG